MVCQRERMRCNESDTFLSATMFFLTVSTTTTMIPRYLTKSSYVFCFLLFWLREVERQKLWPTWIHLFHQSSGLIFTEYFPRFLVYCNIQYGLRRDFSCCGVTSPLLFCCYYWKAQTSPLQSGICPLSVSNWCVQWRKHFRRKGVWSLPTSILFQIELQSSSWMNCLSNAAGHGYTHSIPKWIWFDPKEPYKGTTHWLIKRTEGRWG